ncbi:MAG: hypothetical protein DHS80DRAFT_29179 [Piptocephalis tieghemiana]|nr:MAG: hypothetical protein DHS80DRAFT_29179 [Piptocephalis tieghemiana]
METLRVSPLPPFQSSFYQQYPIYETFEAKLARWIPSANEPSKLPQHPPWVNDRPGNQPAIAPYGKIYEALFLLIGLKGPSSYPPQEYESISKVLSQLIINSKGACQSITASHTKDPLDILQLRATGSLVEIYCSHIVTMGDVTSPVDLQKNFLGLIDAPTAETTQMMDVSIIRQVSQDSLKNKKALEARGNASKTRPFSTDQMIKALRSGMTLLILKALTSNTPEPSSPFPDAMIQIRYVLEGYFLDPHQPTTQLQKDSKLAISKMIERLEQWDKHRAMLRKAHPLPLVHRNSGIVNAHTVLDCVADRPRKMPLLRWEDAAFARSANSLCETVDYSLWKPSTSEKLWQRLGQMKAKRLERLRRIYMTFCPVRHGDTPVQWVGEEHGLLWKPRVNKPLAQDLKKDKRGELEALLLNWVWKAFLLRDIRTMWPRFKLNPRVASPMWPDWLQEVTTTVVILATASHIIAVSHGLTLAHDDDMTKMRFKMVRIIKDPSLSSTPKLLSTAPYNQPPAYHGFGEKVGRVERAMIQSYTRGIMRSLARLRRWLTFSKKDVLTALGKGSIHTKKDPLIEKEPLIGERELTSKEAMWTKWSTKQLGKTLEEALGWLSDPEVDTSLSRVQRKAIHFSVTLRALLTELDRKKPVLADQLGHDLL